LALVIKNTRDIVRPETLKLKFLLISQPGFGKTTFVGNSPNPLVGVCETGHGKGLMSIAHKGVDFTELDSYDDFEAFCSGAVGKDKETLGLDSLSDMVGTFIKDKALSLARTRGESQKRALGVPELDDYGVMGELTRKLVRKLLNVDKHIVATAGLRIDKPEEGSSQTETLIGPALPGQMFLGSTAMFDVVLIGRTRSKLRDPRDAKSRYTERYWLTEPTGGYLAKNRLSIGQGNRSVSFLPSELVFDTESDTGTFNDVYQRAIKAFAEAVPKTI
jgi:AAA domain